MILSQRESRSEQNGRFGVRSWIRSVGPPSHTRIASRSDLLWFAILRPQEGPITIIDEPVDTFPVVPEPVLTGGVVLPGDLASISRYIEASKAENTRDAYASDVRAWSAWASHRNLSTALPVDPLVVASWLADMADAGASPKTIERRLSGLGDAHRSAGHPSPGDAEGVRRVMRGIRRTAVRNGHRPKQARALTTAEVRVLVEDLPNGLAGLRDRALILTAFALGLRASDACWLDIEDLAPAGHGGLDCTVRFSKTDQEGAGKILALAPGTRMSTCPVAALMAWKAALAERSIVSGPLFRGIGKGHSQRIGTTRMARSSVRLILRRAAERAGVSLDGLSPHSARRGFATVALASGASTRSVQATGRWSSLAMLRRYDASSRWADPASARLGL